METNEAILTPDLFDLLMKYVLSDMYQSTFVRFKASAEYSLYRNEVKETYNRVTVDDFEYLELLGSGGFGRVVHARKKSTGKHYGTSGIGACTASFVSRHVCSYEGPAEGWASG